MCSTLVTGYEPERGPASEMLTDVPSLMLGSTSVCPRSPHRAGHRPIDQRLAQLRHLLLRAARQPGRYKRRLPEGAVGLGHGGGEVRAGRQRGAAGCAGKGLLGVAVPPVDRDGAGGVARSVDREVAQRVAQRELRRLCPTPAF